MSAMVKRPIILCFVACYLPGYRSGGPVRSIANLVDHLGDELDIRIVTRDRDALDTEPYPYVKVDAWNTVGKAKVFYASKRSITFAGIAQLLRETPYDVLYLNSFFAFGLTTLPLLARRLGRASQKPCVLAPRGEFSIGAIELKSWKKRPYMKVANAMGLYRGLYWQASSEFEATDIRRELGHFASTTAIAPNLPPKAQAKAPLSSPPDSLRKPGPLRIVFLSRITPKKNLDFLLERLACVSSNVECTIYGPLREPDHWIRCLNLISRLPQNVIAQYCGEVEPEDVLSTFSAHDLFVFPTRGENYGHVVLEALTAGTAVLISDRTPWRSSENMGLEVLRLEDPDAWVHAIERWANFSNEQFHAMSAAAHAYAHHYLQANEALEQNRALFRGATASS
jgi:glycosyltransferase involved in cell wall biosynthesis